MDTLMTQFSCTPSSFLLVSHCHHAQPVTNSEVSLLSPVNNWSSAAAQPSTHHTLAAWWCSAHTGSEHWQGCWLTTTSRWHSFSIVSNALTPGTQQICFLVVTGSCQIW
ncbi:hypothetical protein E2C01_010864 [Portunus trituberculatus]|uniref:Uncharacterized protein n=1 Tax=Portunus trituberculatus TaxID=210409 RepID=A0A5B7D9J5_PORTR|nr:hypothetical protein [Portunus trituberculatus]